MCPALHDNRSPLQKSRFWQRRQERRLRERGYQGETPPQVRPWQEMSEFQKYLINVPKDVGIGNAAEAQQLFLKLQNDLALNASNHHEQNEHERHDGHGHGGHDEHAEHGEHGHAAHAHQAHSSFGPREMHAVEKVAVAKQLNNEMQLFANEIVERRITLETGEEFKTMIDPKFGTVSGGPTRPIPSKWFRGGLTKFEKIDSPAYRANSSNRVGNFIKRILAPIPVIGSLANATGELINSGVNAVTYPIRKRTLTRREVIELELNDLNKRFEDAQRRFAAVRSEVTEQDIALFNALMMKNMRETRAKGTGGGGHH